MKPAYLRLAKLILSSPCLSDSDRQVVKDIVFTLNLDVENLQDINSKWDRQLELEANIIYLLGTYRSKLHEGKADLDEEEGQATLDDIPSSDDEGRKLTGKAIKAYLSVNPDLAVLRREIDARESLYKNIEWLAKIVFERNSKLDNINVNYRRELVADSKH